MKLNITEYILQKQQAQSEKTALILVDDLGSHRKISYGTLYEHVCRIMVGLQRFKLAKGSIICILTEDVYDLLLLFLATNAIGLVPNPLLLSLSQEELNYILHDSDARMFFCLTQTLQDVQLPANCQLMIGADYEAPIQK